MSDAIQTPTFHQIKAEVVKLFKNKNTRHFKDEYFLPEHKEAIKAKNPKLDYEFIHFKEKDCGSDYPLLSIVFYNQADRARQRMDELNQPVGEQVLRVIRYYSDQSFLPHTDVDFITQPLFSWDAYGWMDLRSREVMYGRQAEMLGIERATRHKFNANRLKNSMVFFTSLPGDVILSEEKQLTVKQFLSARS